MSWLSSWAPFPGPTFGRSWGGADAGNMYSYMCVYTHTHIYIYIYIYYIHTYIHMHLHIQVGHRPSKAAGFTVRTNSAFVNGYDIT